MAFLSFDDISTLEKNIDARVVIAEAERHQAGKTVFLSYSSTDSPWLGGVVKFFRKQGASVYVDLGDNSLPRVTTPRTAAVLKTRIEECRRFVLLLTEESHRSRWIPWELGVADGLKGIDKIAFLPVTLLGEEELWAKQEYLGLYPVVRKSDPSGTWKVVSPGDGKRVRLDNWLGVPPPSLTFKRIIMVR